jgi:two-component system NarL family sensor kinase
MTNIAQHARASQVTLRLTAAPGQARLLIEDNGQGFDSQSVPPERYGLVGLNERVRLLGGSLRLESTPGVGTRIEVHVPLAGKP